LGHVKNAEELESVNSVNVDNDGHVKHIMTNAEVSEAIESTLGPTSGSALGSTLGPIQTLVKPVGKGRRKKAAK
jgi:hypothetical protein